MSGPYGGIWAKNVTLAYAGEDGEVRIMKADLPFTEPVAVPMCITDIIRTPTGLKEVQILNPEYVGPLPVGVADPCATK